VIPFCDLKAQYATIKPEIDAAIQEIIDNSSFIQGPKIKELETAIAAYSGTKFAVGVGSGTDALVLALDAAGIGKGDEVITTPFTFVATIEAIIRMGATPVFADIEEKTYNIDVKKIEAKITKKTKALLPVHLYGHPCDMDGLMALAKKHNLQVIEDCAQALGSDYKGKKVGSFGLAGCLSFFPAKNLGCYGDGGMIITDNQELAEKAAVLRVHGCKNKYVQIMHGYNSRLDTLQAAILCVKMKHFDKWIGQRMENAKYYSQKLSGIKGLVLPFVDSGVKHSFNYYTLAVKAGKEKRDDLSAKMNKAGIASGIYYPVSQHLQTVYSFLGYKKGDLPVSEQMQDEVLTLPLFPEMTHQQMDEVVAEIKKYGL
jgi:dTDP-4-amino-4,6-dideoxygalactose transaminase